MGGGIIGLYTAYSLLGHGLTITVIDQGEFGQQSSWASGGILTPLLPWNYSQKVIDLIMGAGQTYKKQAATLLSSTGIDIEFWQCGMQILDPSELNSAQDWCNKYNFSLETSNNTITLPTCAQLRSPRLIQALVHYLKSNGVILLSNTTFNKMNIIDSSIRSVSTSIGEIETNQLIFAGGTLQHRGYAPNSDYQLPQIQPVRGQIIAFKAPEIELDTVLYLKGYYLIPRKDGLILAGSTLEHVGFDQQLTATAREELKDMAFQILPALREYPIVHQWSGLRPGSKNNIPTIGPHPAINGLYLNCGHFRYGVAMAPHSATIIRDWLLDPSNPSNNSTYLMHQKTL